MSEYEHAQTTCSFGVDGFQIQLHKFTCSGYSNWFELDLKITDHINKANDKDITIKNITKDKRKKMIKILGWLTAIDDTTAKERMDYLVRFLSRETK
jgi:hypothetical protein